MNSLGTKLEEYWQEIRHKRNKEDPNSIPVEDTMLVHIAACRIHASHYMSLHVLFYFLTLLSECSDACLHMSSGSDRIKTGHSVMTVRNGANSRMGSTAASCQRNGTAVWTPVLSSGEQSITENPSAKVIIWWDKIKTFLSTNLNCRGIARPTHTLVTVLESSS